MVIWAIIFLEFWKRKQYELQYNWDLVTIEDDHYPIRTEYESAAQAAAKSAGDNKRLNPETGKFESFIPEAALYPRRCISLSFVLVRLHM